jgi:hypothetical protein
MITTELRKEKGRQVKDLKESGIKKQRKRKQLESNHDGR